MKQNLHSKVSTSKVSMLIFLFSLMFGASLSLSAQNDCWGDPVPAGIGPDEGVQINGPGYSTFLSHCIVDENGVSTPAVCLILRNGSCSGVTFTNDRAQSGTVGDPYFDWSDPAFMTTDGNKLTYISPLMTAQYKHILNEVLPTLNPTTDEDLLDLLQYAIYCMQGNLDDCTHSNSLGQLDQQSWYIDATTLIQGVNVTMTQTTANPVALSGKHIYEITTESGILGLNISDGGALPVLCDIAGNPIVNPNVTITATSFKDTGFAGPMQTYYLCLTRAVNASVDFTVFIDIWEHPNTSGTVWYPKAAGDIGCQGFAELPGASAPILAPILASQWGSICPPARCGTVTAVKN